MALFTAKLRGFPVPVNGGSRLYAPPVNGGLTGTGAYGGWAYGVPVLTGDRGKKNVPVTGPPWVALLGCAALPLGDSHLRVDQLSVRQLLSTRHVKSLDGDSLLSRSRGTVGSCELTKP